MSYLGIFYSLMGTIIKMILTLSGDYASILISILLSSFIIFSIFETEKIINYLLEKFRIKINKDICFFISICLIFITAIYIPGYSPIFFGKFFTKNFNNFNVGTTMAQYYLYWYEIICFTGDV